MNTHDTQRVPDWVVQARQTRIDRAWLRKSAAISIRILFRLKEQGLTQKELADAMGITPQQVNKLVKGKENLTLETICKLESALELSLIEIPGFEGITFHVEPKVEPVKVEWMPSFATFDRKMLQAKTMVYDSSNNYIQNNAA